MNVNFVLVSFFFCIIELFLLDRSSATPPVNPLQRKNEILTRNQVLKHQEPHIGLEPYNGLESYNKLRTGKLGIGLGNLDEYNLDRIDSSAEQPIDMDSDSLESIEALTRHKMEFGDKNKKKKQKKNKKNKNEKPSDSSTPSDITNSSDSNKKKSKN